MPYNRPMPDTLDAKVTRIKGWTWNEEPFPYPSPGIYCNYMHWEDKEGKPHCTPEWEGKWWFRLLAELGQAWGLHFIEDILKWCCYDHVGPGGLFYSDENNPGGCVCQAYVAAFEKEASDASTTE